MVSEKKHNKTEKNIKKSLTESSLNDMIYTKEVKKITHFEGGIRK